MCVASDHGRLSQPDLDTHLVHRETELLHELERPRVAEVDDGPRHQLGAAVHDLSANVPATGPLRFLRAWTPAIRVSLLVRAVEVTAKKSRTW